jgi:hypothetical protein
MESKRFRIFRGISPLHYQTSGNSLPVVFMISVKVINQGCIPVNKWVKHHCHACLKPLLESILRKKQPSFGKPKRNSSA